MKYASLTILIPSHSLEDLPLELTDVQAEGLLNAFAVAWHPVLLDSAGVIPNWERADEPPEALRDRLFLIPAVSDDWMPCQWTDHAREQGAVLVTHVSERAAMIERAIAPLKADVTVDPDIVGDFLALGHCHLQLEMLTRQMRYFSELDETRLQSEAIAAARDALAGDRTAAESHLRSCFEVLLEGRERFYPVDCYLADLCLLNREMAGDDWARIVHAGQMVNFLATAEDLSTIAEERPEEIEAFRTHWRNDRQELVGGEWTETCSALLPLESVLPSFQRGLSTIEVLCGRRPTVWGRRRYGVGIQMPQLLDKLGYEAAFHFVMDEGLYPDEEQGKHRWEGCDGTIVDAVSRIPLAADSAAAVLRFPQRMAESMDHDHVAMLILARWPKLQNPWIEDFHRIEQYAPVLGRFVTFSDFFSTTDTPGRISRHQAGDYLSPHLLVAVARQEADPISRYVSQWEWHHRLESARWNSGIANLLRAQPIDNSSFEDLERLTNVDCSESAHAARSEHEQRRHHAETEACQRLAHVVVGGRGPTQGCFVANSCSFARRVVVRWPREMPAAGSSPAIIARQSDEGGVSLIVELPPCGFVWLPVGDVPAPAKNSMPVPMAEMDALRNELFEVRLSEVTGGVAQIKSYSRGPNRLSQQVAFRFPRELTVTSGEGHDAEVEKTWYTQMLCESTQVVSDGPLRGEVESRGKLVDPTNGSYIAHFTQIVRVFRGLPIVEIEVELDPSRLPEGDPWSNYFAARWAWSDPTAALTCSAHEGAHPVTSDRFEAPHYFEIADDEQRTTIHVLGQTFHRKTGPRMLDTLLISAGETRRRFRFVITVEEEFPMERSRDAFLAVDPVVLTDGPEQPTSGWFFHLDCRNVQLTRLMPLSKDIDEQQRLDAPTASTSADSAPTSSTREELGVKLRLRETEGRTCTARLRCFRTPAVARQCDFLDQPINDLVVDGDAVVVEVTPYEICDVEIRFA